MLSDGKKKKVVEYTLPATNLFANFIKLFPE